MKYVSGVHALNIEDNTECCGDWHTSGIQWVTPDIRDTEESIYKEWGIEYSKHIPEHTETYAVANTLRAILDLMCDKNNLGYLKGFRDDFIMVDTYNQEFFNQVLKLKVLDHWQDIYKLMEREFMWEWKNFVEGV